MKDNWWFTTEVVDEKEEAKKALVVKELLEFHYKQFQMKPKVERAVRKWAFGRNMPHH